MSDQPDLPEPDGTPLRICQNPQTGILYLNRMATEDELEALTRRLFGALHPLAPEEEE